MLRRSSKHLAIAAAATVCASTLVAVFATSAALIWVVVACAVMVLIVPPIAALVPARYDRFVIQVLIIGLVAFGAASGVVFRRNGIFVALLVAGASLVNGLVGIPLGSRLWVSTTRSLRAARRRVSGTTRAK
jgi:hypothetical protein